VIVRLISQDRREIKEIRENLGIAVRNAKKYEQTIDSRKKTIKGLIYMGNFHQNW